MEVDFIALAKATNGPNVTIEDNNKLWTALFQLEQWHAISRGEMPNVHPYIGYLEKDKPTIFLFTDAEKARNTATKRQLHPENENTLILSFPTASIVDYLMQFEKHNVWGVWFNPDEEFGFYAPLQNLPAIKKHIDNLNR